MYEGINQVLEIILADFLNQTSNFLFPAKIIAGVGALIMAFITYRKMQMDGNVQEALNGFLIKLFLVMVGIIFYGTVIKFMNAPLNLMTAYVKESATQEYDSTSNIFLQNYNDAGGASSVNEEFDSEINILMNNQTGNSSNDPVSTEIMQETESSGFMGEIQAAFNNMIFQFLSFLASICLIILNIIRTFFLIILSIFGIFVIAFSMFPGLEGSFGQWLQKYINVYLWLPIGYILDGVLSKIYSFLNASGGMNDVSSFSSGIVNILAVCAIVSFATVPTMSSWLVNAATNGMASKVKDKGGSIGGSVSAATKKVLTKGKG